MILAVDETHRNTQGEQIMANVAYRRGLILSAVGLGALLGAGVLVYRFGGSSPVYASATHGTENLTATTGFVEPGAEAIVYLDHVTGELTGYVLSTTTWQVVANYRHPGVNQDLQLANVKSPKYSVVSGTTAFKPKGANRLGSCVVYVAEETTGLMVAYGMPWDTGNMTRTAAQNRPFVKLAGPLKISSAVRRGGGEDVEVEEVKEPTKKGTKNAKK
jgi:hypothetical protein